MWKVFTPGSAPRASIPGACMDVAGKALGQRRLSSVQVGNLKGDFSSPEGVSPCSDSCEEGALKVQTQSSLAVLCEKMWCLFLSEVPNLEVVLRWASYPCSSRPCFRFLFWLFFSFFNTKSRVCDTLNFRLPFQGEKQNKSKTKHRKPPQLIFGLGRCLEKIFYQHSLSAWFALAPKFPQIKEFDLLSSTQI